MSIILTEDDKAPDARKTFAKKFNEITGGDFNKLISMESTH